MYIDKRIIQRMQNLLDGLIFEIEADTIAVGSYEKDIYRLSKSVDKILNEDKNDRREEGEIKP